MHLNSERNYKDFQVGKIEKSELKPSSLATYHCAYCSHHLHGHGWRKRYVREEDGNTIQVYIARLKCPYCKKTYTVIPRGMVAFRSVSTSLIKKLLDKYYEIGHFVKGYLSFLSHQMKVSIRKAYEMREQIEKGKAYRVTSFHESPYCVTKTNYKVIKDRETFIGYMSELFRTNPPNFRNGVILAIDLISQIRRIHRK